MPETRLGFLQVVHHAERNDDIARCGTAQPYLSDEEPCSNAISTLMAGFHVIETHSGGFVLLKLNCWWVQGRYMMPLA